MKRSICHLVSVAQAASQAAWAARAASQASQAAARAAFPASRAAHRAASQVGARVAVNSSSVASPRAYARDTSTALVDRGSLARCSTRSAMSHASKRWLFAFQVGRAGDRRASR